VLFNGHKCLKTSIYLVSTGECGVSVVIYSYNGIVTLTVTSDESRIKNPERIVDLFNSTLKEVLYEASNEIASTATSDTQG
jgi:Na+/serine symporter